MFRGNKIHTRISAKDMSQRQRVIKRMREYGEITRNECLDTRPAITRLGAIICLLNKQGWDIRGFSRDNDFVYKLISEPISKPQAYELVGQEVKGDWESEKERVETTNVINILFN